MLEKLFLQILNMSLVASGVIIAVILLRFPLKKAPKNISYALWSVVLFRLACPFSFESAISLLPFSQPLPQDILTSANPVITSGIPFVDHAIALPAPTLGDSINPMQVIIFVSAVIWITGVIILLSYSIISFLLLKYKVRFALLLHDNVYECDAISSPFVLGLFNPRIYLPINLSSTEKSYILEHERTHIRRYDTLIKPIAFFTLCVHWFNPLCWLSFVLMAKDMELSCDEIVLKKMGYNIKQDYSLSLLSLACPQNILNGSPLAFGESNVNARIKNVLNYKKPTFWVVFLSALAAIIFGLCLLLNPQKDNDMPKNIGVNALILEIDYEAVTMTVKGLDENSILGDRCIVYCGDAMIMRMVNSELVDLNFEKLSVGDNITVDVVSVQESYPTSTTTDKIQLLHSVSSGDFDPLEWAQNLKVEDIQGIALFVEPSTESESYKEYLPAEFEDIVKLLNQSNGYLLRYNEGLEPPIHSLLITQKDGQTHIVTNADNKYLIIDGNYYSDDFPHLSLWNFKGDSPVPSGFNIDNWYNPIPVQPQEISPQEFVDFVVNTFQVKDGVAQFILPQTMPIEYSLAQLSVHVSGSMPMENGANMSLHAFEQEDIQRNWQLGKEYVEKMFDTPEPDKAEVNIEVSFAEKDGSSAIYYSNKGITFLPPQVAEGGSVDIGLNDITFQNKTGERVKLDITLPSGWTMKQSPDNYLGHFAPFVDIYNGSALVGNIFCTPFDLYRDDNGDIPYMSVYNGIMLGSMASWDNEYTELIKTKDTCVATCRPWHRSSVPGVSGAAQTNIENKGILAYNANLLKYVGIYLNQQSVSDEQWQAIAKSVKLS